MTPSLARQLESFLEENEKDLPVAGHACTDLHAYAEKMARNASVFTTYDAGKIVAMVAIYCNDPACRIAYMTLAATSPAYRRQGLVSGLIQTSIEYLRRRQFKILQLRVAQRNDRALRMYRNLGFWVVNEEPDGYLMELTIAAERPVAQSVFHFKHC